MQAPHVLLRDLSPNGNLEAVVETDERVVFLYLYGAQETDFGVRSCWVANLIPAPEELDYASMQAGFAPCLPRAFCRHPSGRYKLDPAQLRVFWFEEGDGAALYEDERLLAVIPGGTKEGCTGFARDCIGESPLCSELYANHAIHGQLKQAERFWQHWQQRPWAQVQQQLLSVYSGQLGKQGQYFAVHEQHWPPNAIAAFEQPDITVWVTLGMSIRPQPLIRALPHLHAFRRIELGFAFDQALYGTIKPNLLASLMTLPWDRLTYLAQGHTVETSVMPAHPDGTPFDSFLLHAQPPGAPTFEFPEYFGERPQLLWLLPLTPRERNRVMAVGVEQGIPELWDKGLQWVHGLRKP